MLKDTRSSRERRTRKITKTVLHDAMTARHKNTLQNSAINHNSINTCTRRMALERWWLCAGIKIPANRVLTSADTSILNFRQIRRWRNSMYITMLTVMTTLICEKQYNVIKRLSWKDANPGRYATQTNVRQHNWRQLCRIRQRTTTPTTTIEGQRWRSRSRLAGLPLLNTLNRVSATRIQGLMTHSFFSHVFLHVIVDSWSRREQSSLESGNSWMKQPSLNINRIRWYTIVLAGLSI